MKALRATTHAISDAGLARIAPAIFATEPDFEVSSRYAFVPTIDVVNALRDSGWFPSEVRAQTVRGRPAEHAKHQIRFRRPGDGAQALTKVGDSAFEVVLTNSHDRTSGFALDAGLFRKVCSNGLIVKDTTLGSISVRHVGDAPNLVVNAVEGIISDNIPRLQDTIERWSVVDLDEGQQLILANRAAELRWGSVEAAPVRAFQLLRPHRYADNANDLWSTFNRVQENVIRGGQRGIGSTGRRVGVRAVGAIDADRKINQGLWETATELAA